jgi:hypothetical protein
MGWRVRYVVSQVEVCVSVEGMDREAAREEAERLAAEVFEWRAGKMPDALVRREQIVPAPRVRRHGAP